MYLLQNYPAEEVIRLGILLHEERLLLSKKHLLKTILEASSFSSP